MEALHLPPIIAVTVTTGGEISRTPRCPDIFSSHPPSRLTISMNHKDLKERINRCVHLPNNLNNHPQPPFPRRWIQSTRRMSTPRASALPPLLDTNFMTLPRRAYGLAWVCHLKVSSALQGPLGKELTRILVRSSTHLPSQWSGRRGRKQCQGPGARPCRCSHAATENEA